MSTKGIYTALSGAMAQANRLDTIANNIANANTPAFKRDQQIFQEYLTANEKPPEVIQVPKVTASVESFYDTQGGDKSFVDTAGSFTDFSAGGTKLTGNSFDLAIEGNGFFEVATPDGIKLTRNGTLTLDNSGKLITKDGFAVLTAGTPLQNAEGRTLQLKGQGSFVVSGNGTVYENGEQVGRLSVVAPADVDSMRKYGSSCFSVTDGAQAGVTALENAQVHQGQIETSNVNVIREMVDMIDANRAFESTQKVMTAYDQMEEKLVNQVPRTTQEF